MSFDPITYAAANAAKLPLGAIVEAFPGDVPTGDWVHLDGTLISKAAYPKAADILGETILFNATPTESTAALTMLAGVSSISQFYSTVVMGDTILIFPGQTGTVNKYRLWRSVNAGSAWTAVDINLPQNASSAYVLSVDWLGDGRVIAVLQSGSPSYVVAFSTNYGQTWSDTRTIVSYTSATPNIHKVCDANYAIDGTGYIYFGVADNQASPKTYTIYALNTATNTLSAGVQVFSGDNAAKNKMIGGRVISAGTSEVHFAYYNSASNYTIKKLTFNGTTLSAASSSNLTAGVNNKNIDSLIGFTDNPVFTTPIVYRYSRYYVGATAGAWRIPDDWAGEITNVYSGNCGNNRLITNTLFNFSTKTRFDQSIGTETSLPGHGSGVNLIGSRFGHTVVDIQEISESALSSNQSADWLISVANSLISIITPRTVSGFFYGFSGSKNRGSYLARPNTSGLCNYNPSSRQIKFVELTGTAPNFSLSVKTYSQANDYSQYLHLPYLPGLCCKLR